MGPVEPLWAPNPVRGRRLNFENLLGIWGGGDVPNGGWRPVWCHKGVTWDPLGVQAQQADLGGRAVAPNLTSLPPERTPHTHTHTQCVTTGLRPPDTPRTGGFHLPDPSVVPRGHTHTLAWPGQACAPMQASLVPSAGG